MYGGQMERRFSKMGVFITGFIVGIVVSVLIAVGLVRYIVQHPQKMIVKAIDMGMDQVVERTVQTMPKDYIGQRQVEISSSAEKFAQAFSQNRISSEEMNSLARAFFQVIADQQITPVEIDHLLDLINQYAE